MKEVASTNDLVKLSWMQALLADKGIESVVLDAHTATYYGGALIDRRLMVVDEDWAQAKKTLKDAGAIQD